MPDPLRFSTRNARLTNYQFWSAPFSVLIARKAKLAEIAKLVVTPNCKQTVRKKYSNRLYLIIGDQTKDRKDNRSKKEKRGQLIENLSLFSLDEIKRKYLLKIFASYKIKAFGHALAARGN